MDADRYQRLKRILFEAGGQQGAARRKLIAEACGDDADLRREVEELLKGHQIATQDLQRPVGDAARETLEMPPPPWDCGPYRIEREVGRGGMGIVFEARDTRDDSRVAVKFIPPLFARAPAMNRRFAREAEMGRRVVHPNVVRTLDVGALERASGPLSYLVMEFVEGESLRDLLVEFGTVPEPLLRKIAIQVSDGLAAIHENGIVHRDLKPENVMLTPDRHVRITDLGVAKLRDATMQLTGEGQFIGSLPYAAPEQCNAGDVGPAADLYALGVVLYELATGFNPFRHGTPAAAIRAHLDFTPQAARDLNPALSSFFSELLRTLMAKAPSDRFVSGRALSAALVDGEAGAWWIERERAAEGIARPDVGVHRTTALYGRDDELAMLRRAWSETRAGQGSIVLIEGEAGVGKSRLVDALLAEADPESAHLLYGSFLPGGALLAFRDAVLGRYGGAHLESALRPYFKDAPGLLAPFSAILRGEPIAAGAAGVGSAGGDVFTAACGVLLRGLARERPTLWVFDDLHDAPDSALRQFEALARIAAHSPVMLVATARPGLPDKVPGQLMRTGRFTRMPLERLSPAAVELVVREAIGDPVRAEALAARIASRAGGNPHFTFALLAALQAEGALDGGPPPAEIAIPLELRELVAARVADLSRSSRAILDAAAVQGVQFDADLIAVVTDQTVVGVLQELAEMERRRGIVRASGRLYRFGHNLLQEVVYAALPERLRREYHSRFADAVAATIQGARTIKGDATGADAEFLAYHLLRGVAPERALRHLEPALAHLEKAYRHESALDLIDRALALDAIQGVERLELLFRQIRRLELLSRGERQRDAVYEARQLAEQLGDPALRARSLVVLGAWLQVVGREPEGLEAFERAAELAAQSGNGKLHASIVSRIGGTLSRLRRTEEALVYHERALRLARAFDDAPHELLATTHLAHTLRHLSRYDESSVAYERAIELAREVGDTLSGIHARASLGALRTAQGRWREAEEHLRAQIAFARESADRRLEAQGTGNLSISLRGEGRLGEARELLVRYRGLCEEVGNRRAISVAAGATAHLEFQVGRLDEARSMAEEGRRRAIETHAPQLVAYNDDLLGKIASAEDKLAEASAHFRAAIDSYRRIGDRDMLAESLTDRGVLEARMNATADAMRTLDDAVETAEALPVSARLFRALAHRARIGGDPADAARAQALLDANGESCALYDRIDGTWALFLATAEPALREAARRDLDRLRAQASHADQDGLRERLPLCRAVRSSG